MIYSFPMKTCFVDSNSSFLVLIAFFVTFLAQEALGGCKNMILLLPKRGLYLRHHSVENLSDVTEDVCQITCYMHASCMSYNYCTRSATCEINDSDHFLHPNDLVRKASCVYRGTENACKSNPCPSNVTCQANFYTQSYSCLCQPGFRGPHCTDIDECQLDSHNCSINHTCINTAGSFDCICKPGYQAHGIKCKDIDECQSGSHSCSINHACVNTAGSYNCICKPGYQAQGITCTDIDECVTDVHNCSADKTCVSTEGSFECRCNDGYKMFDKNCTKIYGDYVITVYTADTTVAGTNANVFIQLHGSHFKKETISSTAKLSGSFERNKHDSTTVNGQLLNMESLSKITMSHDNEGLLPVWHLNKVIVDNKTRRMKYTFTCNCKLGRNWVEGNHPQSIDIEPTTDSSGRPIITRY